MSSLGRTLLIANPASKHGETANILPVVRRLLDGVADYEMQMSDAPCHAKDLARDTKGFDTIVAVGGDGTAHEVVNGIMERPAGDRPAFSLVPTGSGNDYARTLGISFDVPTAVRQIASGTRRTVDLGRCNGAWFSNSIAIGLDARVTAKAVELKVTTGWSGLPLYLRSLIFVMLRQYYPHDLRIAADAEPAEDLSVLALAVTVGQTYGGGFRITPNAVIDDGLLDVCRVDPMPLGMAFIRLPRVIRGTHARLKQAHFSRVTSMRIESDRPVAGQIDGEVMLDRVYEIESVPACFDVIVPHTTAGS